jgi:hypothetical protein
MAYHSPRRDVCIDDFGTPGKCSVVGSRSWIVFLTAICFFFGAVCHATTPDSAFVAVPQVTVEMEKAFLAQYQAAVKKGDLNAYSALYGTDPGSIPASISNADSDMKDLARAVLKAEGAVPDSGYSFVPIKPGQHNEPSQDHGKIYVDNLPAVVELMITFPPPAHPSPDDGALTSTTHLLGIQNHQLVLVGSKEDPHAVIPPPPAPMPAPPNFGLTPNLRHLTDQQQSDDDTSFKSMDEFLAGVKQPSLELLASGKSDPEYCAIYRLKPDLLVCAEGPRPGRTNYGYQLTAKDAAGADLVFKPRWIALVDRQMNNGPYHDITGYVFEVPPNYHGPLFVKYSYSDDSGKELPPVVKTIDWK